MNMNILYVQNVQYSAWIYQIYQKESLPYIEIMDGHQFPLIQNSNLNSRQLTLHLHGDRTSKSKNRILCFTKSYIY